MKNISHKTRATALTSESKTSAGPDGIALTPPNYGIDFLDARSAQPESRSWLVDRPKLANPGAEIVQRLIVNTGHDPFSAELSKRAGWIVASDMDLAYTEGGEGQDVRELDELTNYGKTVRVNENIYLEGHGSPGLLGAKSPDEIATALNPIIPKKYTGKIRSHSCSAGAAPAEGGSSGVESLVTHLQKPGITVEGASGIALNHLLYGEEDENTQGTRVIRPEAEHKDAVFREIDDLRDPVDEIWSIYVQLHRPIGPQKYRPAADYATKISKVFYGTLEHNVETHLVPKEYSIARSMVEPPESEGCCFITSACVQAKGLPDDCLELTTLRAFRDRYIAPMQHGKEMIRVYYENSPLMVRAINQRQDAPEIYEGLYDVIRRCVRHVQEEEYDRAFQTYVQMVIELRNRFIPLAKIPAFFYRDFRPFCRWGKHGSTKYIV